MAAVLPASFRGIPFAVVSNSTETGRRQAEHEYPGRDGVFPEDLGRRGRRYTIQGFIVSDSAVYGGGDVAVQRQLLTAASEAAGPGILVHPTFGALTVSCKSLVLSDPVEAETTADFAFTFVEYTLTSFLGISASTVDQVISAALIVDAAATTAFTVSTALGESGAAASNQWTGAITAGGQDATSLVNLASQLPGPYGRYFAGANQGYLATGSGSVYSGDTTVADLASAAAQARATLTAAANAVKAQFVALTSISTAAAATAAQTLVAQLLASCADPSDAIRILSSAVGFTPTGSTATAVNDLYRRAIVVAIARAATTYQPSSYDDAAALQSAVTALLDNEITVAGDEGDDTSYAAFRALRVCVVADLQARGAALSPLKTFTTSGPLPALVLAQMFYGDSSRADELITEADPINPLFMPTSFRALAL